MGLKRGYLSLSVSLVCFEVPGIAAPAQERMISTESARITDWFFLEMTGIDCIYIDGIL
jgi:hypothetical protein